MKGFQEPAQSSQSSALLGGFQSTETKRKGGNPAAIEGMASPWAQAQARLPGAGSQGLQVEVQGCLNPAGEATVRAPGRETGPEVHGQGLQKIVAAEGVDRALTCEVPGVVAVPDQVRYGPFQDPVALEIQALPGPGETVHQHPGTHEEAQAEPRGQGVGEGADMNHEALAIRGSQGQGGLRLAEPFRVRVLLDHGESVLAGQGQQVSPTFRNQRHRGGLLAAGRYEDSVQGLAGGQNGQGLSVQAVSVHWHRMEHGACHGPEGLPGLWLPWILHRHVAALGQQGRGQQGAGHGGAAGDEEVLRTRREPTVRTEVLRELLPERLVAPGLSLGQEVVAVAAQGTLVGPREGLLGGEASIRQPLGKVQDVQGQGGHRREGFWQLEGRCFRKGRCGGHLPPVARHTHWKALRYVGTAARPGLHPTLQLQFPQGRHGRVASDAQFLGDNPGTGEDLSRTQPTLPDFPHKKAGNLQGQGAIRGGVEAGLKEAKGHGETNRSTPRAGTGRAVEAKPLQSI